MQLLSYGHLSISAISQLLLARFGSNFKQRVLGTYTTGYNCHHNICPGNICPGDICPGDICPGDICPGDICPSQQYLSCYWPDFDHTLNKGSWENIQQITNVTMTFVHAKFVMGIFVHFSNISAYQAEHFRLQSCSSFLWNHSTAKPAVVKKQQQYVVSVLTDNTPGHHQYITTQ